jgi:hypothetical protein
MAFIDHVRLSVRAVGASAAFSGPPAEALGLVAEAP